MRSARNMEEFSLLFDQSSHFLGELATQNGAGTRLTLTADGERAIGAYIKDWQTRGIPVSHQVTGGTGDVQARSSADAGAYYVQRVLMRDRGFLDAAQNWFAHRGMAVVPLSYPCVECWEMLVRLPLEPSERFAMVLALKDANPDALADWRKTLTNALRVATDEQQKLTTAVNDLWKNAVASLSATFAKSSRTKTAVR